MVNYSLLQEQIREMIQTDPWYVPAMSNISALLMETLPDLNWVGFYVWRNGRLVVGPFQGKPACIHIPEGKGVCGTALKEDRALNVPDVHAFPGHIACDSASRSELVIPLHADGKAVAVLDMDSPTLSRFTTADEAALKKATEIMENLLNWDGI
ncbi:MAG: GAF domain-containing protein [Clostridia bacterium]|nr:GAF domain-containing protein [Clostridia bacterium]